MVDTTPVQVIADVLRQHRKVPETAMSANIRGMCAQCRDGAWTEEHVADLVVAALGGIARESRIPDDCDCGNEAHPSWCDDDCVRFDATKAESRWVGGWVPGVAS